MDRSYVWLGVVLVVCALAALLLHRPPAVRPSPVVPSLAVSSPRLPSLDPSLAVHPRETPLAIAGSDWAPMLSVHGLHLGASPADLATLQRMSPGTFVFEPPTDGIKVLVHVGADGVDSIHFATQVDMTYGRQTKVLLRSGMTGPEVKKLFYLPHIPVGTHSNSGQSASLLSDGQTDLVIDWGGTGHNGDLRPLIINWMSIETRPSAR